MCSNVVEERKNKGISQSKKLGERELVKVRAESGFYLENVCQSDHELWLFIASEDTGERGKVRFA